jgi:hypothetical protein
MEKIQNIITSYYKSLYLTKLENLDETDVFSERYHIPKLNQEQVNYQNRAICQEEIDEVMKNFPTKKNPVTDGFNAEFY